MTQPNVEYSSRMCVITLDDAGGSIEVVVFPEAFTQFGHLVENGRLVLVKGAGKPYNGRYYVTRVVHQLQGDGAYSQRFEARRNARDLDGSEQFGGNGLGRPLPGI